jgi:hypothetical protein
MLCAAMLGLMSDLAFAVINLYFSHYNEFNWFFLLHLHGKPSESSKLNISHIEILFEVGRTGNTAHFDRRDETGVAVIKCDVIITAYVAMLLASFSLLSAHKYLKAVLLIHGFSQFRTLVFHH